MTLKHTFVGHKAQINCLDLAPNTSFLASGGKDGKVNIWNLVEGKHLEEIDAESPVNCVLFAPKLYWLVIGTDDGISIYDLPNKRFINKLSANPGNKDVVGLDGKNRKESTRIPCNALTWSKDQSFLYAGFQDSFIRVYKVEENN